MNLQRLDFIALFALGIGFAISSQAAAADITFGAPQVAGNAATDFAFTGTLDRAYAFGTASSVNVGGVSFAPFAANLVGDATDLTASWSYAPAGVSGSYATLLSHGQATDNGPATIGFRNLVPGAAYEVAVIGLGLRARTDCCSAGAGYTNLFVYNGVTQTGGGTIEWPGNDASARVIRGSFVADSDGRQTVAFNGLGVSGYDPLTVSANINAVMLTYAVPEPAAVALLAVGIAASAVGRRRRLGVDGDTNLQLVRPRGT